jgi:hypothetical protein
MQPMAAKSAAKAPEGVAEVEIQLALPDLRVTMTRQQALDLAVQIMRLLGVSELRTQNS